MENNKIDKKIIILSIFVLIGIGLELGIIRYPISNFTGLCICIICLICSIVLIVKKTKLSIIPAILTVILIVIWILNFTSTYNEVTGVIDNTRKLVFKENADLYLNEVLKDVKVNNKIGCNEDDLSVITIYLSEVYNDNLPKKSPFGNEINIKESYVKVQANLIDGVCNYDSYVYLTDGKYSVGTSDNPVSKTELHNNLELIEIK